MLLWLFTKLRPSKGATHHFGVWYLHSVDVREQRLVKDGPMNGAMVLPLKRSTRTGPRLAAVYELIINATWDGADRSGQNANKAAIKSNALVRNRANTVFVGCCIEPAVFRWNYRNAKLKVNDESCIDARRIYLYIGLSQSCCSQARLRFVDVVRVFNVVTAVGKNTSVIAVLYGFALTSWQISMLNYDIRCL